MNAAEFVQKLQGVTKTSSGYQARCPAHDDHNASLSVADGEKGIVLHCHANCTFEAVTSSLNLSKADLFNSKPGSATKPRIVATYDYVDEGGKPLFQVCRMDPKDFRQRAPDGKGGWTWSTKGVRRVLFHLPQLVAATKEGRPVYIAEGEKDCLALEAAGFVATCNPAGAGKWRDEFNQFLAGAEVIIAADKDAPGRKHAASVAQQLQGKARSVKVIEVPDVGGKPCKDAADFFAAGGQAAELDELASNADAAAPQPQEPTSEPALAAKPLSALVRPTADDTGELLLHRFLCRVAFMLLYGPTGVGKSSLALQFMLLWALGLDAFGIMPARPLKSLLIQAENDDGDLCEMRDGIIAGLKLSDEQAAHACGHVIVIREDERTGMEFFSDVVRPLLAEHKPDLLWIDPALAYLGGESSSQKDVGGFLRNMLNPALREFNCGCVVVTHTNKPASGREKPDWKAGDYAYLGTGSAEWANAARAVLGLRSLGSHDVFELRAGKRGGRIGWQDENGARSYCRFIAHSKAPDAICWVEADPEDLPDTGGRKAQYTKEMVSSLLRKKSLTTGEWAAAARHEEGMSEATFHRLRREARAAGQVKQGNDGKWFCLL